MLRNASARAANPLPYYVQRLLSTKASTVLTLVQVQTSVTFHYCDFILNHNKAYLHTQWIVTRWQSRDTVVQTAAKIQFQQY